MNEQSTAGPLPVIIGQTLTSELQPTRITRIQIQRLHNLGNYESVRYEVAVDVSPNDDASKVLRTLEKALEDIRAKSGVDSFYLKRAKEKLEKPNDFETWEIENAKEQIAKHEAAKAKRKSAHELLASLHCTSEKRDAKDNWEDEEDYQ